MAQDAGSVLRALFQAINDHDPERVAELAADDFELIDCATGEKFQGPGGARRNAEAWLTPFPDAKVEELNLISAGDWAVFEGLARATNTGPMETPAGPVEPTGRSLELHFCTIAQVRDGKIAQSRDYYDLTTIMTQLGLMPEAAGATA